MTIPTSKVLVGDWIEQLRTLPDASVHCCVTSPPYWGLRDYGVAGQLGLEKTPEEYVAKLVAGFREVRRVLRDDGTLWLNLGDSYAADRGGTYMPAETLAGGVSGQGDENAMRGRGDQDHGNARRDCRRYGLKHKDLVGVPWRVAFALQADGWVLRQEIIWEKPNPMPESVRDRCTKSHEQIFLFSKAKWSGPEPRRFAHIPREDAKWLALFLDTEGNICAKRAKAPSGTDHFGLQICFANTSRSLLNRAHEIIGCGTVLERPGKNSPMFYYQLSNRQASDLLYELYPHLIIKSRQAALGIYLQCLIAEGNHERRTKEGQKRGRMRDDDYTEDLIKVWATMKSLNHFGNPDLSWVPTPEYGRWSGCASYFYDAEAIKEPLRQSSIERGEYGHNSFGKNQFAGSPTDTRHQNGKQIALVKDLQDPNGRNKRSVWTVATAPYAEAHFATFPPDLIKPCILAGTSARGVCPQCGAPWERVVETTAARKSGGGNTIGHATGPMDRNGKGQWDAGAIVTMRETQTIGWQPICQCGDLKPIPATVLDPFLGSGTTAQVALELGRSAIGIELNPKYAALADTRTSVTPGLPI